MNVLVLNCGSSSLKFQLVDSATETRLARGVVERIGGQALCTYRPHHREARKFAEPIRDHGAAIERVMRWLVRTDDDAGDDRGVIDSAGEVHAVGHRVVPAARASAPTPESTLASSAGSRTAWTSRRCTTRPT